jgi:hypothetical protein
MKVKCIDRDGYLYLTIDKTYKVISDDDNFYHIINDKDFVIWCPKNMLNHYQK